MSRKTKIALPPGTNMEDLDWDDDNHRQHIEDEAYSSYYEDHPKPTMAPPPRSPWWGFWRFFGMFLYQPARRALHAYMRHDYVKGQDVFVWLGGGALYKWIGRGGAATLRGPKKSSAGSRIFTPTASACAAATRTTMTRS